MIEDQNRGSAWTNAFLGICAKEVHLCGDERAAQLIYRLCELTGDTLEYKQYKRRNALHIENKLYDIETDLKKGDCIIVFDRHYAHQLRNVRNEA